jgi:hypothetical protein
MSRPVTGSLCRASAVMLALALAAPAGAQSLGWAMGPVVAVLDLDGDGAIDENEAGAARIPAEFDYDADGTYHAAEISAGYWGLYDFDNDGLLEDEELQAMEGLPAEGVYDLGL